MHSPLVVSRSAARRFVRRALLLDAPAPDLATALAHHGYVQIDPINVCGRMHDHILRVRVRDYREGGLMRHLHGEPDAPLAPADRTAFEHHLPHSHLLVAFPLDAWPHLLAAMHHRATRHIGAWSGRLTPREKILAESILAELAARGPLSSDDFNDGRRARRVWGAATLAKSTLQKLFFHGRVLIARREGQRRLYDLPERVLPPSVLALPAPPAADTARWLAHLKLRQRRLVTLKRDELPHVADLVRPVALSDLPAGVRCPPLYCLRDDAPRLAALAADPAADAPAVRPDPVLLAPLDPLIYDRRVAAALWDFNYTWEAYTPPAKRVRGYYALPVLAGTEIVGHVDPKADRAAGRLRVVARAVRRGHSTASALASLAHFLGLRPPSTALDSRPDRR